MIDFETVGEEQKLLLMGLGLPAMMEVRLLELEDREAVFTQLGPCHLPDCTLQRSVSVMPTTSYGGAVAEFLIWRRLAERVHGAQCPHLRLTKWGQEFVAGGIKNIVMER